MVYLLNATPRAPANPSGMQNLQRRYGLDSLAASVARVDAQGNKIAANKLNKTYKKQITDLNLPGNTDIPKNKFYMDGLFAGIAQGELAVAGRSDGIGSDGSAGYTPFTAAEIEEGFSLRPGELHGYVKYRPPSPNGGGAGAAGSKRIKTETPVTTPLSGTFQLDAGVAREDGGGGGKSRTSRSHSEARTHHSRSRVATPSPPTTRSAAYSAAPPPAEESDEGNESSDDGSRFKQLERERKKKLRMKREAELALGGDYKRRRYDVDGYEFLDSD